MNNDGSSPDTLVWSSGALTQKARNNPSVRALAWLPSPTTLGTRGWQGWPHIIFSPDDVGGWPFSVGLLVKFGAFLGTLHWSSFSFDDLGLGGATFFRDAHFV